MPTSKLNTIEPVMSQVLKVNPTRILDVGVGFGKYGFLMREYLEIVNGGKHKRQDWTRRIDGVEMFEDYVMPHHMCIYDNVYIIDVEDEEKLDEVLQNGYELVVMCNVLEHVKNWKKLLDKLKVVGSLIVVVPRAIEEEESLCGTIHNSHVHKFNRTVLSGYFHMVYDVGHSYFCWR